MSTHRLQGLRLQMLEQLKGRSSEEVQTLSARIIHLFLEKAGRSPQSWAGKRVGLYRALPTELDLLGLEAWLKKVGSTLCYPRVVDPLHKRMEFVEVFLGQEPGSIPGNRPLWLSGPYGIEEPHPEMTAMDPSRLDLIFVPGLAFGTQGERLGRGAGYYDRFLPQASNALRVALTFDDQLFLKLEQNAWDQPVDWVLTERREAIPEGGSGRIGKWFFKE